MRIDTKILGLPVLALLVAAPAIRAQQAPTKIAIINIEGAILATKDGEKAREALRTKFEPRSKDMESRMGEINKLKDQFTKISNTVSADAREKLSREIDDKQKKYQWDAEDFQNELQQEQQKLVSEIGQRMVQIIDEYAKAANYALVLDVSNQTSAVLWAAAAIDITTDIVQLYDKKYGVGSAPAASPAASPAVKPPAQTAPAQTAPAPPKPVPPKK